MKVTSNRKVTIPCAVELVKTEPKKGRLSSGEEIVARLIGKGTVDTQMTTDEIMALTRGWDEEDLING